MFYFVIACKYFPKGKGGVHNYYYPKTKKQVRELVSTGAIEGYKTVSYEDGLFLNWNLYEDGWVIQEVWKVTDQYPNGVQIDLSEFVEWNKHH